MRALIIGLGSMGRRRARLLKQYDNSIDVIGIDTRKERREQARKEIGIKTEASIEKACVSLNGNIDIAFVCTSPLSHSSIIRECLENGFHVFSELNLTDAGYEENIKLAIDKKRILFLSSTFLYRKETQYIKREVKRTKCLLNYIYHVGQYLPDWHPWESYKEYFVSNKDTSGCRELMAIEFPWLIDTFGNIRELYSKSSKNTNLDIDFSDCYQIIFEHETGHKGMISIDVVSRKSVRNFELWGEELYLTWDGTPYGLFNYSIDSKENTNIFLYDEIDKRSEYNSTIIENAYLAEIEDFLNVINGDCYAKYSFSKDKHVISIIDRI